MAETVEEAPSEVPEASLQEDVDTRLNRKKYVMLGPSLVGMVQAKEAGSMSRWSWALLYGWFDSSRVVKLDISCVDI